VRQVGADTVPCSYSSASPGEIKSQQLGADPRMFYYLAAAQWHPEKPGSFVRVRGDGARSAGRAAPVQQLMRVSHTSRSRRYASPRRETRSWSWARRCSSPSRAGAALAAIGLYSVMAYNVSAAGAEWRARALARSGRSVRLVAVTASS